MIVTGKSQLLGKCTAIVFVGIHCYCSGVGLGLGSWLFFQEVIKKVVLKQVIRAVYSDGSKCATLPASGKKKFIACPGNG